MRLAITRAWPVVPPLLELQKSSPELTLPARQHLHNTTPNGRALRESLTSSGSLSLSVPLTAWLGCPRLLGHSGWIGYDVPRSIIHELRECLVLRFQ